MSLCKEGEAERLLWDGVTQIGGRVPVCPSGGFASFGEATGAMGVYQLYEAALQLRGQAGARQIEGAKVGFCQVMGGMSNNGGSIFVR
jgi:acetyl-CoA acetyltransferase